MTVAGLGEIEGELAVLVGHEFDGIEVVGEQVGV